MRLRSRPGGIPFARSSRAFRVAAGPPDEPSLTEREAQVLELFAGGMPTQEIAAELGVSPVTVRRHLGAIAGKVGKRGREQLLRLVRTA